MGCSRCSLVHDKRGYRPHNVICIRGDRREVRAALRYIERHSHGLIVEAPAEVFVKLFCNGGHRKVADEVWASILQERMLRAAGVKDE